MPGTGESRRLRAIVARFVMGLLMLFAAFILLKALPKIAEDEAKHEYASAGTQLIARLPGAP